MSQTIQLLLSQILLVVAKLHADGRYQVFCRTAGHVHHIDIEIHSQSATWDADAPKQKPLAFARAYFMPDNYSWLSEEESTATTQRELEFLRAALCAYLPAEVEQLQEAA